MASVKFILRNSTTKNPTPISLIVYLPSRQRLRYSTNIKIKPVYWSEKTQKVKLNFDTSKYGDNINLRLSEIRNFIEILITELQIETQLTPNNLKHKLDVFFGKKNEKGKENLNFYQYVDKFILDSANRVTKGTIGLYKRTLVLIKEFEKKKHYKIEFDTINIEFYNQFISYLISIGHNLNTRGK